MFGIGFGELAVLIVVGLVVFGPDRLPDFARQAGRMIRQVKKMSQQARDDIRTELGPEYANFELTDLDPRRVIRKHLVEAWEDEPSPTKPVYNPIATGELPPYDADAT